MTFQPPPPPPPPGGPPPPPGGPPGQWGPPPGGPGSHGSSGSGFDPKSVNPLDWGIIGAGLLAFILSLMSFYSYTVKEGGRSFGTGHLNAWHGFFGWFGVLLAIIGSVLVAIAVFAPHVKLPVPARLAALGAYAAATLCLILALFIVPGDTSGVSAFGVKVDKGHSIGYWITLIVIIAGLVLSLMRFQQSGGELPGALSKMPNIGGHGHGPGNQPPPPGYGTQQQPPPPGYGTQPPPPPQQPPPGYGNQPPPAGGGYGPPAP